MSRIPSKRSASDVSPPQITVAPLQHVSLVRIEYQPVCRLPGFNKRSHRVPDELTPYAQAFVARLAAEQVKADLDRVFAELRVAFGLKRSEIQAIDEQDGSGTILIPYLRYVSAATQSPEAADQAVWRREVADIRAPELQLSEKLQQVFGELFDTVEFTPPAPIDLIEVIDRAEAVDDERLAIEYDRQITYCDLAFNDAPERIRITADAFRILHPSPTTPQRLVDSFLRVQKRLLLPN